MAKGQYQKWLEKENLILLEGWKRNGLTDEQIAHNMGVNPRTLERWKKNHSQICRALKVGHDQANFIIEGQLFRKAMQGSTTAMIFWLKNNWRDKYNDSELSPEERKLATARMEKLKADTRISKARAKALEDNGQDMEVLLDKMLDTIMKEDKKDEPK
nr:MAG TPA: terminase small subunit [Caudoviricetes sp.]